MSSHSGALEAVDRILNRGGDADDVLRDVLQALHERGVSWAAIRFALSRTLRVAFRTAMPPTASERLPYVP